MKKYNFIYAIIAFCSLITVSCDNTEPESAIKINFYDAIPLFNVEPAVSWYHYTGRICIWESVSYDSQNNRVTENLITGLLYTEARSFVAAGELTINGKTIPVVNIEKVYGYLSYSDDLFSFGKGYYTEISNLMYGDSVYSINLSNSNYYKGFSFNIPTLKQRPTILSPMNASKVNMQDSLKVIWDTKLDTNLNYRIIISNNSKKLSIYGKNVNFSIIPKEYLTYIGKGAFKMNILLGNYKTTQSTDMNYNIGAVYYSETLDLTLE